MPLYRVKFDCQYEVDVDDKVNVRILIWQAVIAVSVCVEDFLADALNKSPGGSSLAIIFDLRQTQSPLRNK